MNFEIVKDALITALGTDAGGNFTVIGFNRQGKDAEEVSDTLVQCAYTDGDFPKESSGQYGPCRHDIEFTIGITVSAKAKANLNVLNDDNATVVQLTTALNNLEEAAFLADKKFDTVVGLIFNILKAGKNIELGLGSGLVRSPWLGKIRKDAPLPKGALVILTGTILFSCTTYEEPTGIVGVQGVANKSVIDIAGDDVEQTEVETTYT